MIMSSHPASQYQARLQGMVEGTAKTAQRYCLLIKQDCSRDAPPKDGGVILYALKLSVSSGGESLPQPKGSPLPRSRKFGCPPPRRQHDVLHTSLLCLPLISKRGPLKPCCLLAPVTARRLDTATCPPPPASAEQLDASCSDFIGGFTAASAVHCAPAVHSPASTCQQRCGHAAGIQAGFLQWGSST